jgi:glycosyltransferase involved in cell wall biosynthesis
LKNQITVIVIAHNEQDNIEKCLWSLINQSMQANRIVVLVHNSTDSTLQIANEWAKFYSCIKVIPANTQGIGIPYARLAAFEHIKCTDGSILCINGDSTAKPNWIEVMSQTLNSSGNVLVGQLSKFKGLLICRLFNIIHWWYSHASNKKAVQWLWGCGFAFKAEHVTFVEDFLRLSISLQGKLNLTNSAEDYIRAYYMNWIGHIQLTRETCIWVKLKEKSWKELYQRTRQNVEDMKKIQLVQKKRA